MATSREIAVEARGVYKSYGTGKNKVTALHDLTMTVPCGSMYGLFLIINTLCFIANFIASRVACSYGLLGPSGCGKTTLLRCIVGRLKVNAGVVTSLGQVPGSIGHGIPGCRVGYMPQELALFHHFTIAETLTYFGRLHKMNSSAISERTTFLLDFLKLPEEGRIINDLSGGQQRRTSFAIALLQQPELLILDEPTVGVDPLLRQRIWEHMLEIVQGGSVTIIITTHYVEEARQAHMVGMMRSGHLLAESPPEALLQSHNLQSLEDVFLGLCKDDVVESHSGKHDGPRKRSTQEDVEDAEDDELEGLLANHDDAPLLQPGLSILTTPTAIREEVSCGIRCWSHMPSFGNIIALFIKNLIVMKRQVGFLLFEFFLPSFQIILFCLCIGRDPYGLPMAVVNNETCSSPLTSASCVFLQHINNHTIIQKNYSDKLMEAIDSTEVGETWGVISIGSNFTTDLFTRFLNPTAITNDTIEGSTIHVYLDMTNQQVTFNIQKEIINGFESFAHDMLSQSGQNPNIASIPVQIEKPIYGSANPSFTNFMAPGIIISITFFMATGLTALSFVLERKQGLLDRSFVAGVSTVEIMIGHICTQFLVMLGQVTLLLIFAIAVFKVPYEGSLALVVILTLLQGLVGMALGIIWPVESMPVWLRYVSYSLPMTYAAKAMRSILARGWGLEYMSVWLAFVTSIGWGWLLMVISALILACRKN